MNYNKRKYFQTNNYYIHELIFKLVSPNSHPQHLMKYQINRITYKLLM